MDESRQQRDEFEKWFDEHMYIGSKCIADPATKRRMFCAWIAAWQASRAAIEIELPEVCAFNLCELLDKKEVIEAIRAAGIKVKELV